MNVFPSEAMASQIRKDLIGIEPRAGSVIAERAATVSRKFVREQLASRVLERPAIMGQVNKASFNNFEARAG